MQCILQRHLWGWIFLGEERNFMKMKYFYRKSAFFSIYIPSLLPEEYLHKCLRLLLQWGPHREKCEVSTVLCAPAADTCLWHHQCPAAQTARSCIPRLIYYLCHFLLCRVWHYKHQDLYSKGQLFILCQCNINHCGIPIHAWSFQALPTM